MSNENKSTAIRVGGTQEVNENIVFFEPGTYYDEESNEVINDEFASPVEISRDITTSLDLGLLVKSANYAETAGERGSLAKILQPSGGDQTIDVIKELSWTVNSSINRKDIPYIQLKEHKVDGGQIGQQISFYLNGISGAAKEVFGVANLKGKLDVYNEIFPRFPTGFRYKFPYFSKVHYDLTTTAWEKFDKIGQSAQDIGGGFSKLLGGEATKAGVLANFVTGAFDFVGKAAETVLAAKYPVVGIADRPRVFTGHNEGSITIEFPLYNTLQEMDWRKNREFIFLFKNQNLFNKRNFITGLPPVWYEVYVPGQYYSIASCVTNFKVENLGNMRIMEGMVGKEHIVPDAYQVSITLQEMAMPSSNQFQAAVDGEARMRVDARTERNIPEQQKTNIGNGGTVTLESAPNLQYPVPPCWVARAVYGETNPDWLVFRTWLFNDSPHWFKNIYLKFGKNFANFIKNKPLIKKAIKYWMDYIIKK